MTEKLYEHIFTAGEVYHIRRAYQDYGATEVFWGWSECWVILTDGKVSLRKLGELWPLEEGSGEFEIDIRKVTNLDALRELMPTDWWIEDQPEFWLSQTKQAVDIGRMTRLGAVVVYGDLIREHREYTDLKDDRDEQEKKRDLLLLEIRKYSLPENLKRDVLAVLAQSGDVQPALDFLAAQLAERWPIEEENR